MTGTYDPETNTVFWGVGNPYPAMSGDERKGDNLYTASLLALDAKTGTLKWHYQFTPHDLFDWDAGQTPLFINRNCRGRERKLLLQANRNGFFYVLDRTNGELLLAEKFVDKLTWATGIGKDGRPILVPGLEPTREGNKVCPNVLGATNWHSVAFSQATGLFYLMAREECGIYVKPPTWNPRPIALEPGHAALRALDIETGKRVWEVPQIGAGGQLGRRAFDGGRRGLFRRRQRRVRRGGCENRTRPVADSGELVGGIGRRAQLASVSDDLLGGREAVRDRSEWAEHPDIRAAIMPGLACLAVIAVSLYFRCYRLFEPWSGGHNDVGQDLFSLS